MATFIIPMFTWPNILAACFLLSQAAGMAMLVTSGIYSELFGRHRRNARAKDTSALLKNASGSEWVENHEFWEMDSVEEVAF